MGKSLLFFCLSLFLSASVSAQVDCSNIGFELGNTNGWTLSYGTVTDANSKVVFQAETSGTRENEHMITSSGNDPKVPSISMVAPGSTHSIRLGNTTTGTHFSRLKTQYTVTADNTLFQYQFAVLLQNTSGNGNQNHEPYQKPGFNLAILDSNGDELACSYYDIQLQGSNTVNGFLSSGDIQYRPWTTGAIDLRNYVGKTITIIVTAHGCTQRGHFGYAYFDAQCLKSEITPVSGCPDTDGYMTLKAPDGFGSYRWNNGATTSHIRVKANLGDQYNVSMVPLASLDASCALQLDYTIQYKKQETTMDKTICEGDEVAVGDTVYRTAGVFVRSIINSTVCDSTVTLNLKVNKVPFFTQDLMICEGEKVVVGDTTYATTGTFVRAIPLPTGCDSTVTTNLTVKDFLLSYTPSYQITEGDSVLIFTRTDPEGDYEYLWQSASTISCPDCSELWVKPAVSVVYNISVSDQDHVCSRAGKVSVSVRPCGISIPDAFTPGNDTHNNIFYVFGASCVKQVREMWIYNRWGQVVFHNQHFQPSDPQQGWSGKFQNSDSVAGIYPYKIEVELKTGELRHYAGQVNLLR